MVVVGRIWSVFFTANEETALNPDPFDPVAAKSSGWRQPGSNSLRCSSSRKIAGPFRSAPPPDATASPACSTFMPRMPASRSLIIVYVIAPLSRVWFGRAGLTADRAMNAAATVVSRPSA